MTEKISIHRTNDKNDAYSNIVQTSSAPIFENSINSLPVEKLGLNVDEFNAENTELIEEVITPQTDTIQTVIANNLNKAVKQLFDFAEKHKDDKIIQKYASKLKEIINNKKLILTNIDDDNVAARAIKNDDNTDTILIDNYDSVSNFESNGSILKTLLHELRHTMETDDINSKAEELEAETMSRELFAQITGQPADMSNLSEWLESGYRLYAEASPGTYNIPQNEGIAVWYKPEEVKMNDKDNVLIIKSSPQEKMNGMIIEDYVKFGEQKDEKGNSLPVSAQRVIKNQKGEIISTSDYGEYDFKKRKFNYSKIYIEQKRMENKYYEKKLFSFGLS